MAASSGRGCACNAAILIIVVWFLAIAIFGIVERLVEPKTFHTVWLGMWWALVTVTTVGYGDVVPKSSAGRIISSFLLMGGLAFLTVIIAMISGGFVTRYQRETSAAGGDDISQGIEQLSLAIKQLRTEVQDLRAEVQEQRPIAQR